MMLTGRALRQLAAGSALAVALAACGGGSEPGRTNAPVDTAPPSGTVTVDGSSTLLPLSCALGDAFHRASPAVTVNVSESGTAGGFEKLCTNAADLIGASRPINAAELRRCTANRVEFIELPLAFDSVSIVVNPKNTFAECLTVPELKRMWEPAAAGTVTRWNQVRASFPAQPLTLAGPGAASGTFDYFTLAVVGAEGQSRMDYLQSEDDEEVAAAIIADANAAGYFGYDYYVEHRDELKLVAIDGGRGCVRPTPESVADGTYQPLSRPLFVYATTVALAKPAVKALARMYVDPANAGLVREIGFVPLPTASLLTMTRRLETGETGSRFGGRGSVLGLTLDTFQDEERIKNALVR